MHHPFITATANHLCRVRRLDHAAATERFSAALPAPATLDEAETWIRLTLFGAERFKTLVERPHRATASGCIATAHAALSACTAERRDEALRLNEEAFQWAPFSRTRAGMYALTCAANAAHSVWFATDRYAADALRVIEATWAGEDAYYLNEGVGEYLDALAAAYGSLSGEQPPVNELLHMFV